MNSVLMLCYYFPPLSGGGVQRNTKFVKYLPEFGWRPIVVSVELNRRNRLEQGIDESLLDDVAEAEIYHCRSHEFSDLYYFLYKPSLRRLWFELERLIPLLHVDYKIGWYKSALDRAGRRIEKGGVSAIYSSSTPYSAHLIARKLKNKYNLPWVADFRDAWTLAATYNPRTRLHAKVDAWVERVVLTDSDAVVANTETNKTNLVRDFHLAAAKIHAIPNGFDPEDFQDRSISCPDRFVISCLGKFYDMPDSGVFFRAYRRLSDAHRDTHLSMLGWYSRTTRQAAQTTLKSEMYEIRPRVDHDHAIQIMKQSAILLVNLPNGAATHWVPGKLYEYVAAGRPVLFVGPPGGEAADIVRRTGSGLVSDFDEDSIFVALEKQYQSWRHGYAGWAPVTAEINHFNRRCQAQRLAEIFGSLTAGPSDPAARALGARSPQYDLSSEQT